MHSPRSWVTPVLCKMQPGHTTVLLKEAVDALDVSPTDCVVDATVGGAGHFSLLMSKLGPEGTLIGIDADDEAIARGEASLEQVERRPTVHLVNDNFRHLSAILDAQGIRSIDKSLFDLGWSGFQLYRGRGFSFQEDEPLLMTYGNPDEMQTAADVMNGSSEKELADILWEYGEEQFSRRIAKGIVESRRKERILTTFQLVEVIKQATPHWYHTRRIHPATKTFQALRIYVNDEFGALEEGITAAIERTAPSGRIAVITFHSTEDRIVKNLFRDAVKEGKGELGEKKPIVPTREELQANPRARSAKLRTFTCL